MLPPCCYRRAQNVVLAVDLLYFFGDSWHGWLIPCLPSWFPADGLKHHHATAFGLLSCKVLTSKIQIPNPKITTCSFITWNQLVNLQIVPQPLVSHFALLNSEALKHKCYTHPLALNLPAPHEDGVAKDGAFQLEWAQCCPGSWCPHLSLSKPLGVHCDTQWSWLCSYTGESEILELLGSTD